MVKSLTRFSRLFSDVIDWILDNLSDKTRTRRGILKKLKELGLMFKAPTKKSSAATAAGKNLWGGEEDNELHSLYDQYRTEEGKNYVTLSNRY